MLKITGLALVLTFSLAAVGSAQKTGISDTPLTRSATKEARPQGSGTEGASGVADESAAANKLAGREPQPAAVVPTVKCAITLPDPGDQSVSATKWLDLAKNCHNSAEDNSDKNPTTGLNDRLFLAVSLGAGQPTAADKTPLKLDDWRLSINGVQIDDAKLTWEAGDDKTTVLSAKLKRTDSSKTAWNELLAQKLSAHTVPVTVTDTSKKPLPSGAYFNLQVIQLKWYSWILLGILLLLMIILMTQDRLLQMLREDGPYKKEGQTGAKAAYSLSRVQMFYWFSIAILCYVVIWVITGDRDTINNDVLTLMGISAGTFLGAVSIDSSKKSQAQSELPDAVAKLRQTQTEAAAIGAVPGAAPAAAIASQAATLQQDSVDQLNDRTLADYNENFLTDILSDENGLSFHRFQIFAWSLVCGIIFIASVLQTLSMPTFGNTLLGLMGISAGTYLGFKFPEQKTK